MEPILGLSLRQQDGCSVPSLSNLQKVPKLKLWKCFRSSFFCKCSCIERNSWLCDSLPAGFSVNNNNIVVGQLFFEHIQESKDWKLFRCSKILKYLSEYGFPVARWPRRGRKAALLRPGISNSASWTQPPS